VFDECGECGGDGSACAEPAANLFFSEHAEGSSNNKYFEVYNASDGDVSLGDYAYVNCTNGCDDWEYTNSFAEGASVAPGATYTVCHSSADEAGIIPFCDETRTVYHNGDDAQGLMHTATNTLLDLVGAIGDDPGSGWEVAGVADATKDHTLVRKSSVESGNTDWASSAGTNSDDSEWVVLDQNTWDYIGSHPHDFSTAGCMDPGACNYDADASSDDGSCLYKDCLGECGGSAVEDDCGPTATLT
jgi:predicted extracellular nuclease